MYKGVVPERLNLFREKGDTSLPHRVELGDFYGYTSFRTLQRSLKGVQVEFQPTTGPSGWNHSILFISGTGQSSWRDLQPRDNYTNAASWLMETPKWGRWGLNFVQNSRQKDASIGTLSRSQWVASLAGQGDVSIGSQILTFEGEFGYFSGDHDGMTGPASGQDRQETGVYLQISGRGAMPLTYRVRYEAYGQDYRPEGAVVPADRRSAEGYAGWRFQSGLEARGRIQYFRDFWETPNPQDTKTVGLTLTGPMLGGIAKNISGSLDMFLQDVVDKIDTVDMRNRTVNLNLSKPVYGKWNAQLGIFYQKLNNRVPGATDTKTEQLSLSGDHPLSLFGFQGNIAPGFILRDIDDTASEGSVILPTLSLMMQRGPHSINYSTSYNYQDRFSPQSYDVSTFSNNLIYRYTLEKDIVGVELTSEHRDPKALMNTASYRFAVYWTHYFEKQAGAMKQAKVTAAGVVPEAGAAGVSRAPLYLQELAPGADMRQVKERLARADIKGAQELPGVLVYNTRLLEEIDQRQRLALVHDKGFLEKSVLIIDFEDVGRPDNVMLTIERVRDQLIRRYGTPSAVYNIGEVTPNLVSDIQNGRFIRITEWSVPGGIIRFGVPRRLDGQIRMEVQFAKSFPPPRDAFWSIETAR